MKAGLGVVLLVLATGAAEAQVGWAIGQGNAIPRQAPAAGQEATGQALYACVAPFNGSMQPGKTRPDFGGCNIPFGGREHVVSSYRVPMGGVWRASSGGRVPANALPAGFEANGAPLYICRGRFNGGLHPGKIRPEFGGCNIPWGGGEHVVRDYEVLSEW